MSKKTAARIAVRDVLIQLVELNRLFREAIESDYGLPIWIMDTESTNQHALAAGVATRLTYIEEQNKQETARLTGLVGVSAPTLTLGEELNLCRDQFKTAIADFRKLFGDSIEAIEQASDDLRDGLLGGLQVKHLHFVQCYRQLKLFPEPPRRVGFSWAASHSGTVRLTVEEAIEHFRKKYLASVAVNDDICLLEKMPAKELVVIKRILAPHLRANITWPKDIQALRQAEPTLKKQYPAQINSPLPLFIQLKPGEPLPEFNRIRPYDPTAKQERLQRSDARLVKINDNPHSRIYRYV
ncbi:DNA replication terminus site-binding protein [Endozoicomonas sp. ONNA2]|uniref:DNA replication terminus site-binding protein n=1 Tax=Endozoicomonas sp. ONNA2 TaxID=2828741 RepID=UPI002148A1FD|nr:DNA replication terminus site-binding protein [Endozoicomonas sp. ONNA2]